MNATKDMTAHGGAEKYQAMYPIDPSLLSIITNVRGSVTRIRSLAVGECARTQYSVLSLQSSVLRSAALDRNNSATASGRRNMNQRNRAKLANPRAPAAECARRLLLGLGGPLVIITVIAPYVW